MTRTAAILLLAAASACGGDPCLEQEPGALCALAGTGTIGFNGDGLPPEETKFNLPSEARVGPDGRTYIMDFNNFRLRVIGEDGTIQTVAGSGVHGYANTAVPALESPLENPIDFEFLPDGRLVLVSYHDPRVLVLEDDQLVSIAGTGTVADAGDGGPALEAMFEQLDGIALRPDGAIYVSDSLANRVRLIEDGKVTTVAGTGERGYSGDGGPGDQAELYWPTALALDDAGNLYIAEKLNGVIRRLAPDGTITTIAGTGTLGFSGDGGPATEAELNWPSGIAIGSDGTLYVSDAANFRVRRISPDGIIETIAGTGEKGLDGVGGSALDAQLGYLARVQLDGDSLLVVDQSNSCVRRLYLGP